MQNLEPNRKIIISSPINQQVAQEVIEQIIAVNDHDAQMSIVKTYQPEPIEMFINSGGGSATDGFAIIGAMEMSETPIVTYGMGIIASMALAIFAMGDYRLAHRHARFMYHSVAYGEMGYIKDHEDGLKEADVIQRMYNSIFHETKSKISKEKMAEIKDKKENFFFSAKKAVELNVANEIMQRTEKAFEMMSEAQYQEIQDAQKDKAE
jgi:ATP-dependent Clp protease, protease subunit